MARQTEQKKTAYRKKLQNRSSMILIMSIVLILLLVVGIKGYGLTKQRDALQEEFKADTPTIMAALLHDVLDDTPVEAQEIEEYKKYMQTPQYYEEMAKEKLGLVYENEVIFVPEE